VKNLKLRAATAMILALGLTFAAAVPASAGTIYTGPKSCGGGPTYAYTSGYNPSNSTIKHYQVINGTIWASPTSPTNTKNYSVFTYWYYSTSNHSFSNSWLTTSVGNPGSPQAQCA
jgi:hypothetical protein